MPKTRSFTTFWRCSQCSQQSQGGSTPKRRTQLRVAWWQCHTRRSPHCPRSRSPAKRRHRVRLNQSLGHGGRKLLKVSWHLQKLFISMQRDLFRWASSAWDDDLAFRALDNVTNTDASFVEALQKGCQQVVGLTNVFPWGAEDTFRLSTNTESISLPSLVNSLCLMALYCKESNTYPAKI